MVNIEYAGRSLEFSSSDLDCGIFVESDSWNEEEKLATSLEF